jgi:exosortase A-associated hydrolase 1
MPEFKEQPITYTCQNEEVIGILHPSEDRQSDTGVLIIVGGPQYRIGSHRLFVKLSRFLADHNIHCFRFDLRGMGDASGSHPGFNNCEEDILSAINAFTEQVPELKKIALWGLCDGAIAASLALNHPFVEGACLINPWINTEQLEAKAYINHYYLHRLMDKTFWLKVFSLKVNVVKAIFEVFEKVSLSRKKSDTEAGLDEILHGRIDSANRPILFVISENDITGQAFLNLLRESTWRKLLKRNNIYNQIIKNADHTFSTYELSDQLFQVTFQWIQQRVIQNTKESQGERNSR